MPPPGGGGGGEKCNAILVTHAGTFEGPSSGNKEFKQGELAMVADGSTSNSGSAAAVSTKKGQLACIMGCHSLGTRQCCQALQGQSGAGGQRQADT